MRKRSRFGTLESRFYLIFTLIFFATILGIQIVSFRFTVSAVRNATFETKSTLLEQLVERINTYIADMERISEAVTADSDVIRYLSHTDAETERPGDSSGLLIADIEERLTHYTQVREDISAILIIRNDGEAVSGGAVTGVASWADYSERPWYQETVEAGGTTVVSGSYVQNLVAGRYSWVVSLSRQVRARDGVTPLGILLVDLKFNRIRELCDSLVLGDNGYTFIIDDQDRYVFHPAQQLVYSGIRTEPLQWLDGAAGPDEAWEYQETGRNYMAAVAELTGWKVVSVSFDSDMITGWGYVQITYAVVGLAAFIALGLITNFISQGITRPLYRLQEVMRSVETGEFMEAGNLKATDEIRELAREYDLMVGRIRELMRANEREQELKRKSDLKALQAQIHPHFLYNTLDSIIWMAEMNKSPQVVQMTSALSRLFRISISGGRELIPLREELDHVRSYLTIQKMRYQDKFEYAIQINDDLERYTVLKIILQPLVENAIYHGVRDVSHAGIIEIGGEAENGSLDLWVRDNGSGMDADELQQVNAALSGTERDPASSQRGVGVRNVHERIRLYFGEQYGLTIQSEPESGTTITCRLPLQVWEV